MKKNKWALVLKENVGDVIVEKFNSKQIAEEELEYRNSLTIAMGYSPDVKYTIKKL
jgi:twinkle protein